MILKAMKKYFNKVEDINIRDIEVCLGNSKLKILYNGKPLEKYDCIYARGSFRLAPLLRSVTNALWGKCYMPIRAETFTIGHDKLLTHLVLQQHKIPMPTTYLASSPEAAKNLLKKINYPLIMKFPQGTQGRGVMYLDSFAAASSMLDALTTLRQPFIIQEYIETGGIDIRAIVIGNKVVASMKRKAIMGEKRANIHAGGVGESCILNQTAKKIAIDTAQSIGAEICAIDMLESAKGPLVIEANLSPGLQGITAATNIDIADKIAKYLYEKTKEFIEFKKKEKTEKIFKELDMKAKHIPHQIITTLDFRANRILLPEVVTEISKFNDKEELIIKVEEGKLIIEKEKTLK